MAIATRRSTFLSESPVEIEDVLVAHLELPGHAADDLAADQELEVVRDRDEDAVGQEVDDAPRERPEHATARGAIATSASSGPPICHVVREQRLAELVLEEADLLLAVAPRGCRSASRRSP